MRELLLQIDADIGRRAGLERALRDAIRDGKLLPGTSLPSTRALAAELELARATVVAAYEQLVIEGYLIAKQGAGTKVADVRIPDDRSKPDANPWLAPPLADFRPGEPDPGLFPRSAWARSVRRVLSETSDQAFRYADPLGVAEVRNALAEYLGRSRAVAADSSGISIFGGITASFGFLGEAFRSAGISRVAVEDPSLFFLREVLALVGIESVPVPVDEEGMNVEFLSELDVGAAIVTPGHQYPLGVTMSADRRSELIAWARNRGTWIVEDDYDGEFRYDRRPIGALQGLDPERVIYAGTASKMLSPGLRLSWLVTPPGFRGRLARAKHLRGGVSTIEQLAFADFINRGDLDRHLRVARATYQRRSTLLTQVLTEHAPWLTPRASGAGLHLAAAITVDDITEASLMEQAVAHDVGLLGYGPHWAGPATTQGLVLGYSRPAEHQFPAAVDRLVEFLQAVEA